MFKFFFFLISLFPLPYDFCHPPPPHANCIFSQYDSISSFFDIVGFKKNKTRLILEEIEFMNMNDGVASCSPVLAIWICYSLQNNICSHLLYDDSKPHLWVTIWNSF